jgi:hypothetical protein
MNLETLTRPCHECAEIRRVVALVHYQLELHPEKIKSWKVFATRGGCDRMWIDRLLVECSACGNAGEVLTPEGKLLVETLGRFMSSPAKGGDL